MIYLHLYKEYECSQGNLDFLVLELLHLFNLSLEHLFAVEENLTTLLRTFDKVI